MRRTVCRRLYGKPTCFEGLPDGSQREARTFLSGGADERRCPLMANPEPTFWTDIEFPWQSIPPKDSYLGLIRLTRHSQGSWNPER
jgi:hypothetical protein